MARNRLTQSHENGKSQSPTVLLCQTLTVFNDAKFDTVRGRDRTKSEGSIGKPWHENRTNLDRNLAVIIGIDRYEDEKIHDLSTPVSDAKLKTPWLARKSNPNRAIT